MTVSQLFTKQELPDLLEPSDLSQQSSQQGLVHHCYQISFPISPQKVVYGTQVSNTTPIDRLTQMRTSTSRLMETFPEIVPQYFSACGEKVAGIHIADCLLL